MGCGDNDAVGDVVDERDGVSVRVEESPSTLAEPDTDPVGDIVAEGDAVSSRDNDKVGVAVGVTDADATLVGVFVLDGVTLPLNVCEAVVDNDLLSMSDDECDTLTEPDNV